MFGDIGLSPAFQRANWSGSSPEAAFAETTVGRIVTKGDPAGHASRPFREGRPLSDPLALHGHVFTPSNLWEHDHFSASGGNIAPYCHLIGGARIEFQ
jgi:hypothetical protein